MREGEQVEIKLSVCDVCADPTRRISTYEVSKGGETAATDRCDEHGAPFEEVLRGHVYSTTAPTQRAAARKSTQGKKPTDGRRRGTRITTMEEIEQKKTQRS